MRPPRGRRRRLACLALSALLPAAFAFPSGEQHPLAISSPDPEGTPPSLSTSRTTIVDLLSSDIDHSLLLRLLQRSRLITSLNRLNGSTFFAPTNDAIHAAAIASPTGLWAQALLGLDETEARPPIDNVQSKLRATLLYHLLNYTLPYNTSKGPETIEMHETLLFPHPEQGTGRPDEPPSHEDDGDEADLLAGEGQKVRVARVDDARTAVGVDSAGKGGAFVVKPDRNATNGNLVSIGAVLDIPKSIGEIITLHPALRELHRLLPTRVLQNLSSLPHLTLFAPIDASWAALSPLEWRYLNSGFADTDLAEILADHLRSHPHKRGQLGYTNRLVSESENGRLVTDGGASLEVEQGGHGRLHVNQSAIIEADIFASNGVIHIIDSLLLPADSLALTVEKTLIALNATSFVAAMRSAKLSEHIQHGPDDGPEQTIFAFQDAAIELDWVALPEPGTQALKETLQYHIVEGAWKPKHLKDGQLLDTALRPDSLRGSPQRLPVSRPEGLSSEDSNDLVLGNANVLAGPYEVGKSIVYVIGAVLEPPPHALEVAMTDLRLSTFAASTYAAELEGRVKHSPATTIFAPINDGFKRLGLVMNYLLLPAAKAELKRLLLYHAVDGLLYLDGNITSSESYLTLDDGSELVVERFNKTTEVHGPTIAGFPANGDLRNASVIPTTDVLLTSTGVLHVIDQVELPPTLDIDLVKLMRGAKATTMLELIKLAGMSWLLDGSSPPDEDAPISTAAQMGSRKRMQKRLFNRDSYTILCPSDKAFSRLNMTYYRSDIPALRELLELHIIRSPPPGTGAIREPSRFPGEGRPLVLEDEATYSTLLSGKSKYGDVAFRSFGGDSFVVGVKGARGASGIDDWASVTNFGRATPRFVFDALDEGDVEEGVLTTVAPKMVFGGGVLAIDAVLTPYRPGWYIRWGWIVVVVALSVSAAVLIGLLVFKLVRQHKALAYSRLEGEEDQ